jgi:hypothetical protein
MGQGHVEILAHHGLLLAIPAFVPAIAVAGVVFWVARRDRRQDDGTHSEREGSADQDGST